MYIINKRYEKYIPKDFNYEKLGSRFDEVYKYFNSEEAPVESNGDEKVFKHGNDCYSRTPSGTRVTHHPLSGMWSGGHS